MTQKEIEVFLTNTKVYVNGKSREIQEKLFSLGYKWNGGSTDVSKTEKPFLYIFERKAICCGDDMKYFINGEYREITAEQILSLEVTEPSYRLFKDKEECWQEMLKHHPFGWVICDEVYRYLIEISDYSVIFINDDREVCSPFPASFLNMKFADGTPFGIKK